MYQTQTCVSQHEEKTYAPRASLPFWNHMLLLKGLHKKLGHCLILVQHKRVCITQHNILHFESRASYTDGNSQYAKYEGATEEKEVVRETPIKWEPTM